MIYVLLYKEMEMALTIKSIYSKTALMKLHPTNIKVFDIINFLKVCMVKKMLYLTL